MSYENYLKTTAPPYMQDPYGQAWMGGIGAAMDDYVQQYIAGVQAAFPDYAPSDALGILGDEIGLDRGPTETDANYAARLAGAWSAWKYAGTPIGMIVALYWAGFSGAVVIQQNGMAFSIVDTPVAGQDPFNLLMNPQHAQRAGAGVIQPANGLTVAVTSTVTPPVDIEWHIGNPAVGGAGRSVPIGTPFFPLDGNTDFCSRFAIYFPSAPVSLFRPLAATATFTGTEDGSIVPWPTATWSLPFYDAVTHKIFMGGQTPTDGGFGPVCNLLSGSKTATSVQVTAGAKWQGTVDLLGYGFTANDVALLSRVINKWKPAKSTCTGVYVAWAGRAFGWPVQTWSQAMSSYSTFPQASVVRYPV